jgi:hypothetical protein
VKVSRKILAAMLGLAATSLLAVPAAAVDASLIADPPNSSYKTVDESLSTTQLHLGQMTADQVVDGWAGSKSDLTSEGFVGAFQKAWTSGDIVMAVEVDEFKAGTGAKDHVSKTRSASPSHVKNYKSNFGTSTIPDSYGFRSVSDAGENQVRVFFSRGKYSYDIGFYSTSLPSDSTILAQAKKQYDKAPNDAGVVPVIPGAPAAAASGVGTLVIGGLCLLCLVVTVLVIVFLVTRSRRKDPALTPVPPPASPMAAATPVVPAAASQGGAGQPPPFSPDRKFWWDGTTWQDCSQVRPPGVAISPDGKAWWDGAAWRPNPS